MLASEKNCKYTIGPVITHVLMSLHKVQPIDHLDCLHVEDVVGPVDSEHRES